MFKSKESLRQLIKDYLDNPKWGEEQIKAVQDLLLHFPDRPAILTAQRESQPAELIRLRASLIEILADFDIVITKNNIVFQEREKSNWWYRNYGWVLGVLTAIFTALGTLIKFMEKR